MCYNQWINLRGEEKIKSDGMLTPILPVLVPSGAPFRMDMTSMAGFPVSAGRSVGGGGTKRL